MNLNIDYSEIITLHNDLVMLKIPHDFHPHPVGLGGFQIAYPSKEKCKCSVILCPFSYGANHGELEIMGFLTPEEEKIDSVVGGLSAEEVLARILEDYTHQ